MSIARDFFISAHEKLEFRKILRPKYPSPVMINKLHMHIFHLNARYNECICEQSESAFQVISSKQNIIVFGSKLLR